MHRKLIAFYKNNEIIVLRLLTYLQAQNNAGAERLTVPLTVNVPPKWIVEPKDTSTRYMDNTTIDCEADGQPKPTITWKKAVGNQPGDYKDFLFESKTSLLPNGSLTFYEITKLSQSYYLCGNFSLKIIIGSYS